MARQQVEGQDILLIVILGTLTAFFGALIWHISLQVISKVDFLGKLPYLSTFAQFWADRVVTINVSTVFFL